MGYKVALVGATGNVGREMLNILDERKFPADEVVALASRRSMGVEVSYGDRTLKVKALEHYDFSDVDICLMSAGGAGWKGMCAEKRGRRRGRDRQLVGVADGSRRAADRARGQRGRGLGLRQEEHHRQSELLHRADRGGAEAAARTRQQQ